MIPREKGLDLYSQPYVARDPVIGRDEQPQPRRADQRPPQPARPGHPATYDYAYVRCGTCTLWLFVEPMGPWRTARATARRTAVDWARQVKVLADHPRYRQCAEPRPAVPCRFCPVEPAVLQGRKACAIGGMTIYSSA